AQTLDLIIAQAVRSAVHIEMLPDHPVEQPKAFFPQRRVDGRAGIDPGKTSAEPVDMKRRIENGRQGLGMIRVNEWMVEPDMLEVGGVEDLVHEGDFRHRL